LAKLSWATIPEKSIPLWTVEVYGHALAINTNKQGVYVNTQPKRCHVVSIRYCDVAKFYHKRKFSTVVALSLARERDGEVG
jgi:hypothetical protein